MQYIEEAKLRLEVKLRLLRLVKIVGYLWAFLTITPFILFFVFYEKPLSFRIFDVVIIIALVAPGPLLVWLCNRIIRRCSK